MKKVIAFFLCLYAFSSPAQDGYKTPPKDIMDMVLAEPTPSVSINDNGEWMLLLQMPVYKPVEELARPELRIAGLRIDPMNFTPSRQNFITGITLKSVNTGIEYNISGLPSQLRISNISWSPSGNKFAFIHTTAERADLYVVDILQSKASKFNKTALNTLTGPFVWVDESTILYRGIVKPSSAAPVRPASPSGPAVQENTGKASPRPTFQDMIKSPYDESLFEFYATSQLILNKNGTERKIGSPALYNMVSLSPDKRFLLVRKLVKPFSYLVPASGFPSEVLIMNLDGALVKELFRIPSLETAPSGNDNIPDQPRSFEWRDDHPATVAWSKPLDGGLVKNPAEYRDAVYTLSAPFTSTPVELFKTKNRYRNTIWGTEGLAIVTEGLTGRQYIQMNRFSSITGDLEKLFSRNTTDAYSNPGNPVTAPNGYGRDVLLTIDNGNKILLNNTTGSSPRGDLPFLLSFDVHSKKADTLWRSAEGLFEMVVRVKDANKLELITKRESASEMPNYWLKNLRLRIADRQLTNFKNPYPQLEGVTKEKVRYTRADGVTLTGDLYLPRGYDAQRDGPLPLFIWAYPAEFNSASDAGQVRGSEHKFTLLNWGSAIYYVTQGYAVLNNAEMPIVAMDSSRRPNDNFIDQVRMNAESAIRYLAARGVADSHRVAVGGHSYGAFMTANLLAHTKLFKAGIARSGAYNRSLTPFGFQNEDRTFWQAPDLYNAISPFSHADKIKTPLLLVHGELDNNTGTYPIQSERMFNAIKGHGGTVRYVSLPYESHGYAGRENILHTLAEQFDWLEKHVKNANAPGEKKEQKAF